MHAAGCARQPASRPRHELGEILRVHGEAFSAHHAVSPEQATVLRALAACRTAALGGHLDRCLDCGEERPAYNSCRNRHCPKCQSLDQARWLAGRLDRLLPVPYFHVVFTLPAELRGVALANRRRVFDLLFQAASETLLTLGRDPERLGAQLGATLVLHTWTRDLRLHPHVHAVVTGGGLAPDGERWVAGEPDYLFPVGVLSALWRGKMLDLLTRTHGREPLALPRELRPPGTFERLRRRLYEQPWITYAKPPFAGPEEVYRYLGRYTHRVALSNHRLLEVTDDAVTLRTRGDDTVTLTPEELIRRFLRHVLPTGFVKIRHYGLLASGNVHTRLATARRLLEPPTPPPAADPADAAAPTAPASDHWRSLLQALTGIDPRLCPACGSSRWVRAPLETPRAPRPPPARAEP